MKRKKGYFSKAKRERLLLLLPVTVLIGALSVYPVLRGIWLGFTSYKVGRDADFNGLGNYVGIYNSGFLGTTFKNIAFMMVVSVVIIYLLSMTLALLLNSKIPLRPLWRTLLIIPWAVPPVAKISMWKAIFDPLRGYANAILLRLGWIDSSISWLSDTHYAIWTVICVLVWGCIPFLTLSLLSTLQQIPSDIQEAAALDGASRWQMFRFITLPYLSQTTSICMSLIFVWIMNDFTSQFLMTGGGPGSATLTPIVEAYRQGFKYGNFGYASAYGNMMILCVSVVVFFYIRAVNKKDAGVN